MLKADGSVSVHSDGRAYKPLNWMSPPCHLRSEPDRWVVTNNKGETLTIAIEEVHADHSYDFGIDRALQKDGVEAHLQELLAAHPEALVEGLRLVRREYPTDIGPVDLLCRDTEGRVVAVEIKRRGEIDGVEQLFAVSGAARSRRTHPARPRHLRRAADQAASPGAGRVAGDPVRRGGLRRTPGGRHRPPYPLLGHLALLIKGSLSVEHRVFAASRDDRGTIMRQSRWRETR